LASLLAATRVAAQDTNRAALVIGLHGPGVLIPISSTTAFRLDGTLSESSTGDLHVWNESVGMSALFYFRSSDALRSFVGPRVAFLNSSGSGGASAKTWSGQLFFGAEYALGRRFGVFGEAGLSYGRTTGTRVGPAGESVPIVPSTFWSTVSGVGLLYRF
jgi:hypothetical protein